MMMNKNILWIIAFLFTNNSFSQVSWGGLSVITFKNNTDKLADNFVVDTTYVKITNSQYSIDTTVTFIHSQNTKIILKDGKYNLALSYRNEEQIELTDVIISGDRISFVEVLIEPRKELSKRDIRNRKKKYYANYL